MAPARGLVQCLARSDSAHLESLAVTPASAPHFSMPSILFYPQGCFKEFPRKLWEQMAHFCWLFQISLRSTEAEKSALDAVLFPRGDF